MSTNPAKTNLALQALLTNLIDYAGLFPPAALAMPSAVRNYAAYRGGEYAWMLGRFVVPVSRLAEFAEAAAPLLPQSGADAWQLSALCGAELAADVATIAAFNQQHEGRAVIDTIEFKADNVAAIEQARALVPEDLAAYVEIPLTQDPRPLLETISEASLRAKARTGGVTADAFPSALQLARFIKACADEDVPFKATAGLHHPLRSLNRLTYETNSDSAVMHGFLNVFLAAAFAQNGMPEEQLAELLEETVAANFQFDLGSVFWRGEMAVRGHLRNTRNLLAISFGSCSFTEPIEDLQRIGLL